MQMGIWGRAADWAGGGPSAAPSSTGLPQCPVTLPGLNLVVMCPALSPGQPSSPEQLFIDSPVPKHLQPPPPSASQGHIFSLAQCFEAEAKVLFTLVTGSCFSKLQSAGGPCAKQFQHLLKLAGPCGESEGGCLTGAPFLLPPTVPGG